MGLAPEIGWELGEKSSLLVLFSALVIAICSNVWRQTNFTRS